MLATFAFIMTRGLLLYVVWQLGYYIKVEVLDKEKIRAAKKSMSKKTYETSFTMLRDGKGAIGGLIRKLPRSLQHFVFGGMQLMFTVITMLPTVLFFYLPSLHFAWIFLLVSWSAWNGANFYVEVFSARYQKQLQSLATTSSVVKAVRRHTNAVAKKSLRPIKE